MSIVGGLDIHRSQITFDWLDMVTGEVRCGQVRPADREHLRQWLALFAGQDGDLAMEGCTGWRYVAEEVAAAGLRPHVADPAELAAQRGRKRHAKTDRADARFACCGSHSHGYVPAWAKNARRRLTYYPVHQPGTMPGDQAVLSVTFSVL